VDRLQQAPVLQRANEDDGAGDAHGEPEHQRLTPSEAEGEPDAGAGRRRQRHLNDRPRDGDGSDAQQVSHVEMEADTEHEENDPKFSEFADGAEVGIVARREGGNDHAGCKIANDR